MRNIYVVKFEKQIEVMTQDKFKHFLEVCVLNNKDITSFQVWDLSRKPIPVDMVPDVVAIASTEDICLCGGAFTLDNDSQYLYED